MPIYEYQCQNCGRTLEKRQKFSDAALTVCPYCEGRLEKLISAPAVQFKGGGWYADGYGNTKSGKSGDSSSSGSASNAGSTGSTASTDSSSAGSTASAPSTPAPSAPASTTK